MKISEILSIARDLISNTENWCQRSYGSYNKYCASSAIWKAAETTQCGNDLLYSSLAYIAKMIQEDNKILTKYNDSHTHDEVINLFDRAIVASLTEEISSSFGEKI